MAIHRNVRGGKPSPYPRKTFHALRSAQLLGAVVVSGIMVYFMTHLAQERYPIPWTFILLLAVSLATIIALIVTIALYNFTYLSPRFNLILNGSISLGWGLGLGLLTWSIAASNVLQKQCTSQHFGSEAGAGVCREYKSLWAMTFCGTVSTILAVFLDIFVYRREARLGLYALPADDQAAESLKDLKTRRVRDEGYELPEEQVNLEERTWQAPDHDTSYHNSYGSQETRGPLDSGNGDLGYRDRL